MPYIINASQDYADEFDYPITATMSDNFQHFCANYPSFYHNLDFDDCYFGTNEYLSFRPEDIQYLFKHATYVDDATLNLVTPFMAHASWDPCDRISEHLFDNYPEDFVEDIDNLSIDQLKAKYPQHFL